MNLKSLVTDGNRSLKMYAGRLEKLGIIKLEDFLFHLPFRYEDYSLISKIAEIQPGETVTIKGKIIEIKNQYLRGGRIKTFQNAIMEDETGQIKLTWFNQPFIIKNLPVGTQVSISGTVEGSGKILKIKSPKYEALYNEQTKSLHTGRLIPIYPETKGISSKWLRRQIHNILTQFSNEIKEYMPIEIINRNRFPDFKTAINSVHFPKDLLDAEKGRKRLSFDELFLMQLAAQIRRQKWNKQKKGNLLEAKKFEKKINTLIDSLPFELTNSQNRAVGQIFHDLSSSKPMNRLLQGDVGSGKTVVSAIAMYLTYLNGYQSVLMAPTEILAEQHFATIDKLLKPLGIQVGIVTGSKKTKIKDKELGISKNAFDVLIGTHAVLQKNIKFDNLGLVVIDEQQRFGVAQRGLIREKGKNPHLLTMTATPIPRTVALTLYGDLDLSYLSDMPMGRKIIKTWVVPPQKRENAYEWIKKQIKETKSQAFIICPFIEESETMTTIKAATVEFEKLRKDIYPDLKLGLLHGKLKSKEKQDVLEKFRKEEFDILVATPVVEVGIDIPNATIIMIEASERFGLAQLHQMRGRVGRGDKQSYCLLFTDNFIAQSSKRLKGMETLYSGAELAELDLHLRGPGNMYGTAQHGVPKMKAANFSDTELIQKAKIEADRIQSKITYYPVLNQKIEAISSENISPD